MSKDLHACDNLQLAPDYQIFKTQKLQNRISILI